MGTEFWDFWIYVFIMLIAVAIVGLAVMLMMRTLIKASSETDCHTEPQLAPSSFISHLADKLGKFSLLFTRFQKAGATFSPKTKNPTLVKPDKVAMNSNKNRINKNQVKKNIRPVSPTAAAVKTEATDLLSALQAMPGASSSKQEDNSSAKSVSTPLNIKTPTVKSPAAASVSAALPMESKNNSKPETMTLPSNGASAKLVADKTTGSRAPSVGNSSSSNKAETPVASSDPILELPKLNVTEVVHEEKLQEKPSDELLNLFETEDEEATSTSDLASTLLDVDLRKLNHLSDELTSDLLVKASVSVSTAVETMDGDQQGGALPDLSSGQVPEDEAGETQ